MTMKKKILSAAVVAALSAGSAQAVNISQDGTGEVLIFPYFTVQGSEETVISVVNTTQETKAVKIRFREAYNSRELLDFNLYLSPFDVWTGKVMDNDAGDGAKIVTNDASCTVPAIGPNGEDFRKYEYTGQKADGGPDGLERTREGYIEVIEMGVAEDVNGDPHLINAGISLTDVNPVWDMTGNGIPDSTHVAGVPENCATLIANWKPGGTWVGNSGEGVLAPSGGLFGAAGVINVQTGTEISANVTVLDAFSDTTIHTAPGSLAPNLQNVSPAASVVLNNDGVDDALTIYEDTWMVDIDAVSAVLMAENIYNEYSVNPNVDAETDWVVTFPTKWAYVNGFARMPFSTAFVAGEACEPVAAVYFDREEAFVQGDLDFSPLPPGTSFDLCWEVNVVNFGGSDALSAENTDVDFDLDSNFVNGWASLGFLEAEHMLTGDTNTHYGLPVIGFRATKLGNANVGVGASYAVSEPHKYYRSISGVSGT